MTRLIGRCQDCKTATAITLDHYCALTNTQCRDCGRGINVFRVHGIKTDKKCGASCRNAKYDDCECSCEGQNHGTKWEDAA